MSALSLSLPTSRLQGCNPEYIVSSNRYDILEDFGPAFAIVNTPLTYVFFTTWPVIIGLISLSYCGEYPGFPSPFGASLIRPSQNHLRVLQAPTSVQ